MNLEYLNEVMEDVRNKVLKHFAKEAIENLKNGKKKEPSKITGSLAIDIMRGYNQITYVDNEIDYALTCKSKEIDDDEFHCYMFTRNCTNHYLMDIKDKLNGDIKNLNICSHYALLTHFEKKIIKNFHLDGNQIIENKPKILYDHLIFQLNDISPHTTVHPFGLNICWEAYWNNTISGFYKQDNNSCEYFDFRNFITDNQLLKNSEFNIENQKVISNNNLQKINSWSDKYESVLKEIKNNKGKSYSHSLKEELFQYDWDTRFLFLSTHLMINLHLSKFKDDLSNISFLYLYGELVSNTLTILEQLGIDEYESIRIIPNFFIRLYDYLIPSLGHQGGINNNELNWDIISSWYGINAIDFLDTSFK